VPVPRLAALVAVLAIIATGAEAQTLRERLQKGAAQVQEGAAGLADRIDQSVQSSVDLMTNEPTPQETRDELDAMAIETLARLFDERPQTGALFDRSAGYAVFDTRKVVLFGLAAGAGRGVAASLTDEARVYMNMGTAGVGMAWGVGGFESQVVIFFEDAAAFETFVTYGYDATAEAGTMLGADRAEMGVRFVDGRAIFVLTNQGWKVSATAAGTKYWADPTLN
jgi:lipid-binding SYLF domain-containing protein